MTLNFSFTSLYTLISCQATVDSLAHVFSLSVFQSSVCHHSAGAPDAPGDRGDVSKGKQEVVQTVWLCQGLLG